MRQQRAQLSIPRRASAMVEQQGQRYYTTQASQRRPPQADTDEDIYEERSRSSVVRYRPLYEEDTRELPPVQPKEKRRISWLLFIGIVVLVMLVGWVLMSLLGMWWQ